jgi:uncharacterized protein YbaR (Trm112 family)/2-polyprenyl-3-methyl-5-hydroxy-6-metoxy-1,4-benzoquinol methylase
MKRRLLQWLACPSCRSRLEPSVQQESGEEIIKGMLVCSGCSRSFPVVGGIPRFVGSDQYASSFGYQWNRHAEVQLDSRNGTRFSETRFRAITGWTPEKMKGSLTLDVGCGAGRFAEVALADGSEVVAMDLSSAVDACQRNLGAHPRLHVVQASIYEMPFRDFTFDRAYCIGVIQHTPDPRRSIASIARMVAEHGSLGLWIYEISWKAFIGTVGFKYLFRPLTMNRSIEQIEKFSIALERAFWPILRWGRSRGLAGRLVMRMLPVSSAHLHGLPLSDEHFREWVRLDTFDMYSPAHDHPQTFPTVRRWLDEEGFATEPRHPHGGVSITARRSCGTAIASKKSVSPDLKGDHGV